MKYTAAILALVSLSAHAQAKPDTAVHFADYMSYAGIGTYRTFDYLSTRRGLALGGRERELPQFVVDSPARLAAFEGIATAVEVGGSIWLIHHNHRKLARAENFISIGLGSATVAHNYTSMKGAGK